MISVQRYRPRNKTAEINISPLIDLVFLLLIFFVVTTSFVKETGIDVERPKASTAALKEKGNILIGVSPEGSIYLEGKQIDIRSVRAHVERALAENPEGGVVVVADKVSQTGTVVQVMDQCRLAGAKNVSIATAKSTGHE